MRLDEFRKLYENKEKHYPITDAFCIDGYMTKNPYKSYLETAKNMGMPIDDKIAEPNQKWHFLVSYCDSTDKGKDAERCYNELKCPELLLWMAEAAGFDVRELADEARRIMDEYPDRRVSVPAAGRMIKKAIPFDVLVGKLKNPN